MSAFPFPLPINGADISATAKSCRVAVALLPNSCIISYIVDSFFLSVCECA